MSDEKIKDDVIDVEPKLFEEPKPAGPMLARGWQWIAVPAALLLIGLVAGSLLYRDWLSSYFPSDEVATLARRVDALEAGTKDAQKRADAVVAVTEELKAKLEAAQSVADKSAKQNAETSDALAQVKQGLAKISGDMADLQGKLATGSGGAPDEALAARVAALEKQAAMPTAVPAAPKADAPDVAGNLAALKSAIADGAGFATPLAVLAKAKPQAAGLDVLLAEGAAGLPNATQLAQELQGLAGALPKTAVESAADSSGWWASFKGMMSRLVRIKRAAGADWATLAAKAQAFAAAGDLQQATDVFAAARDVPPALQGWIDKAKRREKLEQALEQFSTAMAKG